MAPATNLARNLLKARQQLCHEVNPKKLKLFHYTPQRRMGGEEV
jgi:hypothetical protein